MFDYYDGGFDYGRNRVSIFEMSIESACEQFKLDTQNLLHEMDISILRGEYQHLFRNWISY